MDAASSLLWQGNKIGETEDPLQHFPEELHMPLLFNNEQQNLVVNDSLEQEERREHQSERATHEATANSRSRARRAQSQVVDNE